MKRFARLYRELDGTNSTLAKLAALERYFRDADAADAAWAVYFLAGNKPRQVVPSRRLYELAGEVSGLPQWLMDECYEAVGDLAETVALVLPAAERSSDAPFAQWVEERLLPLASASDEARVEALKRAWSELDGVERLIWNKLITGEFRIGVSLRSVTRALAAVSGMDPSVVAHRLAGAWRPSARQLSSARLSRRRAGRSEPALSAVPRPRARSGARDLGRDRRLADRMEVATASARQLIRRGGEAWLWSRGEELINETFPDLVAWAAALPEGTVIDGEIVVWQDERAAPFNALQKRIGRKAPVEAVARAGAGHADRLRPARVRGSRHTRHAAARRAARSSSKRCSRLSAPLRTCSSRRSSRRRAGRSCKTLRASSRERGVEGMMLKRRDAAYGVGRVRGPWWKWKIEPYTVDAVLMYAQRGTAAGRASIPTTPSACGTTARWCLSPRRTRG